MRVLVTGASGMLGAAVARRLAERGDEVVVLQRRPSGLAGVAGVSEVLGDITDRSAVGQAARGVTAVVHLAAKVGVTGSWRDFAAVNIDGTRTVLDVAREAGAERFVQVSSPSVAHVGRALVGVEAGTADPVHARGNYARSKAAAELFALEADGPDLAVLALRPHLVWGPGDTQLVGRIIQRARAGRLALIDRGAALIDTTYVSNAADAIVAGVDRLPAARRQALVISNGEPRTVAELVSRICQAAGVAGPRLRVPYRVARAGGAAVELVWTALRRTQDPPMTRFLAEQLATAHWFDQRQTRDVLQWSPAVSLDRGFELLAASYRR